MAGIRQVLRNLIDDAAAKFALISDREGEVVVAEGHRDCQAVSQMALLAAKNVSADDSLSRLIGEREFSILFHEADRENVHVLLVTGTRILTAIFDDTTSLGRVRLAVKKHSAELNRLLGPDEPDRGSGGGSGPDDPDQGSPPGGLVPIRR